MTGKGKNQSSHSSSLSKQELEVEKLRDENKWLRLRDYVSNLTTKDNRYDLLVKFCIAESDLENYLFANPLIFSSNQSNNSNNQLSSVDASQIAPTTSSIDSSTSRYDKMLYDAEIAFKEVISKSDKNILNVEANVLLSKLFYSQMRYEEASKQLNSTKLKAALNEHLDKLKSYQQSQSQPQQQQQQQMQNLTKTDSLRQLQLFAEAHSIKGLCLELKRSNNLSNAKQSDESKRDEQDIIDSFEMSSIFAIHHSLVMHQKLTSSQSSSSNAQSSGQTASNPGQLGTQSSLSEQSNNVLTLNALNNSDDNLDLINPLYEIALQKAPLLYIKRGDLQMGMKKFRELLLKKNIQSITSIRQILLRKFAESLMFNIPSSQYTPLRLSDDKQKFLFKPANQDEEILLCLTLSQYLASKEVMLLRQAQFKQIREYTFNNAVNSLDLLLIFLSYHRSYNVLIDKFEMAMKYSFEEFYVWYQYGLTLMCDQKYYKAYMVFKECSRMKPDHVTCHLLLAQIALEQLLLVSEAIEWCIKVHELTNYKNKKAHIIFGSALCMKAKLQKQHAVQISFYEQALESFKKANSLDPSDYLALFHISHCYAILRQINEAIEYIQKALKYKPDDKDSLHLLALLLTSTKNYEDAHTIMCKACALYDDFELLYTKIRIEEILYGFNHSVNSLFNLILIYKQKLQQPSENVSTRSSSAVSLSQPGAMNPPAKNVVLTNQSLENTSSFENACLLSLQHAYKLNESIGKSITMLVQNDQIALKYGNSSTSQNIQQTLILTRLLTQIGEFYLRNDKINDAEMCCQEMATINPMSYLYIYLRGRIFEYKQDYMQAKICYQNALSINPYHIQSLQQMALVLCQMQNFHLAEKMIRDAISLNSGLPDSWHILARVLDYQNDNQSAMKCYQTCLQLEATNPILPFTSLTRIL